MTDNIKPEHYRKGETDLYEAFSQIFPHNEYRAGMQMIAMRYMFRDKNDRVEDLNKSIYTLERLKEKEIEYRDSQVKSKDEVMDDAIEFMNKHRNQERITTSENIHNQKAGKYLDSVYLNHKDLLRRLSYDGYLYLARDRDGVLYASDGEPYKVEDLGFWDVQIIFDRKPIQNDDFPEVKWSDEEPTKIADLWEIYSKGEVPNTIKPTTAGQYWDEIYFEHADLLKRLLKADYLYLARDENGELYAFEGYPKKYDDMDFWDTGANDSSLIKQDNFPEIKWSDEEPTEIVDLLATYSNGGESGKVDGE